VATPLDRVVAAARRRRWVHLVVVNLRILLGFAFVPAGLKKVLGQPFTDLHNVGPFHDFLHAFRETGGFYRAVGVLQLAAAALLMTQRHASLGAVVALPIITAIVVFCWSTRVTPTAIVASLMWAGTFGLVLWDLPRWRALLRPEGAPPPPAPSDDELVARASPALWGACGAAIFALHLASNAALGRIYRPRGIELDAPGFWVLLATPLLPLVTFLVERRRRGSS
jgi:uncharacterized membrane protein YphA (DoxX/SURF4 family)